MKNTIYENGVYIYANGALHAPESFEGTTGKVIIIMGSDAFEISPEQIEHATWQEAMEFASSKGGNLPDRLQRMIMWGYRNQVQMALEKIGGTQLGKGWDWLCEEYSSYTAWRFHGLSGYLYCNYKKTTYTGRPLLAFQLDELVD